MKMTKKEYEALEKELQELKAKLEKCEIVNGEFETDGKYVVMGYGEVTLFSTGDYDNFYNSWRTQDIAKKAAKMQRHHNAIMNYISQKQTLGEGNWIVFKNDSMEWSTCLNGSNYFPDMVAMLESTAKQMIKDIKSGYFPLEKLIED